MYIPKAFEVSELRTQHEFIESHGFATLVSNTADGLFASHIPLVLNNLTGERGTLAGHVARANPHWRALDSGDECLAIFSGPHAYISPSWYETAPAVPTWNYAAVHVYGRPRIIDDAAWVSGLLDRMVAIYESRMAEPWRGILPAEFRGKLIDMIVGFVIEIDRIEGKFKLGQNRPREDQAGTVRNLEQSADPMARELARMTRRHLGVAPAHIESITGLGAGK